MNLEFRINETRGSCNSCVSETPCAFHLWKNLGLAMEMV